MQPNSNNCLANVLHSPAASGTTDTTSYRVRQAQKVSRFFELGGKLPPEKNNAGWALFRNLLWESLHYREIPLVAVFAILCIWWTNASKQECMRIFKDLTNRSFIHVCISAEFSVGSSQRRGLFWERNFRALWLSLFAVVRPKLCYAVNSTGPCVFFLVRGTEFSRTFFAAIEGSVMIISF